VLLSVGVLFKLSHISSNMGLLLPIKNLIICIPCLLIRSV
jgi:hypothetical protein